MEQVMEQVVFAVAAVTGLACATILALHGLNWQAVMLTVVALVAITMAGGTKRAAEKSGE